MRFLKHTLLALIFAFGISSVAQAQSAKLLAMDTFMGAGNGTILGLATMALNNNYSNWGPIRVGFGGGTLYGLGLGIYDVSQSAGGGYVVQGTFASGNNTAYVIFMDSFYGGATGGIVGLALSLISENSLMEGVQYGAGLGTWLGFGFGLVDVFVLSGGGKGFNFSDTEYNYQHRLPLGARGLLQINHSNTSLGLISPEITTIYNTKNLSLEMQPSISIANFSLRF